jgi:PAS domain S-box-containing protein
LVLSDSRESVSCAVSLTAERSQSGEVIGVLALAHDITELRKQQVLEDARLGIFEKMASGASLEDTLALLVGYLQLALPSRSCRVQLAEPRGPESATHEGAAALAASSPAAGWSEPIIDKQGHVLGTSRCPRRPAPRRMRATSSACARRHIAAIAIERWRSESLLRSASVVTDIFDHTLDMLCLLEMSPDACLRCVEVNPALLRALGKAHGDVIGESLASIFGRLSAQTIQALCERCTAAGRVVESDECMVLRHDVRQLHLTLVPVVDSARLAPQILVISRDITQLTRARQKELERQHDINTLVENSPDAVARLSAHGDVLYVNARLRTWLGGAGPELVGMPMDAVAPGNHQAQLFRELVAQVIHENKATEQEFRLSD